MSNICAWTKNLINFISIISREEKLNVKRKIEATEDGQLCFGTKNRKRTQQTARNYKRKDVTGEVHYTVFNIQLVFVIEAHVVLYDRGAEIDDERQFTEWWHGNTPPSGSASSPSLMATKPVTIVTGPHSPSKSRSNSTARMHRTRSMSAPRYTQTPTAVAGTSPRAHPMVPPIPLKPHDHSLHSSLSPKSSPRSISGSSSAHKRNKSQSGIGSMLGTSPGTKLQAKGTLTDTTLGL